MVPTLVVPEDPTLVVPSLVVLEDPTLVVSEVATEPPNFTAAAIIKKAVFAFGIWAVLRAWEQSEFTPEPARDVTIIDFAGAIYYLRNNHGFTIMTIFLCI